MNRQERRDNKKLNATSPGKNWKAKFRAPNLKTKLFKETSPEVQAMKRAVREQEEKENVFTRMLDQKLDSKDSPETNAQPEGSAPLPGV